MTGPDKRNREAPMHTDGTTMALSALTHILGDDTARDTFIAQTGAGADALRAGARDPAFLAGVLDFILADEGLLLDWCGTAGHAPGAVVTARRGLPGAEALWT